MVFLYHIPWLLTSANECLKLPSMKTVKILTEDFSYSAIKLAYVTGASLRSANRWIKGEADPIPIFETILKKLVEREQRRLEAKEARAAS